MIANTLRIAYRYTERALTPADYSGLVQANIKKQPLQVRVWVISVNNAQPVPLR